MAQRTHRKVRGVRYPNYAGCCDVMIKLVKERVPLSRVLTERTGACRPRNKSFRPFPTRGRVDLGGRPPRPPTEPDVHVKCIRLVTLWRCPSHDPAACGDTLMRHGVLGAVPTSGPQRGTPFAPRGPGRARSPASTLLRGTGHSEFLTAFSPHFVSFAWRYLGASAFRPRSAADAWPTDHPGVCCTGCSWSGFLQGTVRTSHVKPVRSFAMFLRPRRDQAAHLDQGQDCLTRPPRLTTTRAHDEWLFRGSTTQRLISLSTLRGDGRLSLRKTRFSRRAGLARLCRTGLVTRRVSLKGFTFLRGFSFPELRGARSDLGPQPIMPLNLPVKVRSWELTVCPRSHIRRWFGVTRPAQARM